MSAVSWSFTTEPPSGAAPIIIGQDPAPNATGVQVTSDIRAILPLTVTFNKPVEPSTIAFELFDSSGNPVPSSVWYSDATNTATLTPDAVLADGATYTVMVGVPRTPRGSR